MQTVCKKEWWQSLTQGCLKHKSFHETQELHKVKQSGNILYFKEYTFRLLEIF